MAMFNGNDSDNIFVATIEADVIRGNGGNDQIFSARSNDWVYGGSGDDRFIYGVRPLQVLPGPREVIDGGTGYDTMVFESWGTFLDFRRASIHSIEALKFNSGGIAQFSADHVGPMMWLPDRTGLSTTLRIVGSSTEVDIVDFFITNRKTVNLETFSFGTWQGSADIISGDRIFVQGSSGEDRVVGSIQNDIILGGASADDLRGGRGVDEVKGEAGNDELSVKVADISRFDILDGGEGTDAIRAYQGANLTGARIVSIEKLYLDGRDPGSVNLISIEGRQVGTGGFSNTTEVHGWNGQEREVLKVTLGAVRNLDLSGFRFAFWGTEDQLEINGSAAREVVRGANHVGTQLVKLGGGNDIYTGGFGRDIVIGGMGRDEMNGLSGNDVFVFETMADMGTTVALADVITGYVRGHDKIDVSRIDAVEGGSHTDFTLLGMAAFTAPGQIRYTHTGGNTIVEFNTSGSSVAEGYLVLSGPHSLSFGNFIL